MTAGTDAQAGRGEEAENAQRALRASDGFLAADLAVTEQKIGELLGTDTPFIAELLHYAAGGAGKRFRPRLTILSAATAGGFDRDAVAEVAACIECIHLATLLHDDVIDESPLRRGKPSVHRRFGNKLSILGGDYIFTRVFQYLAREPEQKKTLDLFISTANRLVVGEFFEVWRQGRLDTCEEEYVHIITLKSAQLMAAACEAGAVQVGCGDPAVLALREFGLNAGLSFQVTDDWLDFSADASVLGKEGFADIRSGKVTLPLIYGLDSAAADDISAAVEAIWEGEPAEPELGRLLYEAGALERTRAKAREYADLGRRALDAFPPGEARELLASLADWTWQRAY